MATERACLDILAMCGRSGVVLLPRLARVHQRFYLASHERNSAALQPRVVVCLS